ncbi:MAG TPA: hypothetical protein VLG36_02450 [Candidatus Chromulinivoraceae bacterium]|nr:hypothetical protein [Candidatus Chromulinivoraceae bacterium]
MITSRNARGASVSIIIIAVLFIALMATLGVVFYQNFITKPTSNNTQQTTTAQTPETVTSRVAYGSSIYALDYPKTWEVIPKTDASSSTIAVMNPSGTIRVNLAVSAASVDTTCNTTDGLQITSYNVENMTVKSLVATPLYLVEALYDNTGGGYQYKIGLVPDGGDVHASIGATHCNVAHVGIASTTLMNGQTMIHPTIQATIDFPKLPVTPKPAADHMQTIQDLMNSNDYKAAVRALESARKE